MLHGQVNMQGKSSAQVVAESQRLRTQVKQTLGGASHMPYASPRPIASASFQPQQPALRQDWAVQPGAAQYPAQPYYSSGNVSPAQRGAVVAQAAAGRWPGELAK